MEIQQSKILFGQHFINFILSNYSNSKSVLPIVIFCLEQEKRLPFVSSEGPYGLIVVPSQELAKQIQEAIEYFCSYLSKDGFPSLQSCIAIDGIPSSEALDKIRKGVHMMVATPGRLMDMLYKKIVHLVVCQYMCLNKG